MKLSDIKINPLFENLLPPLSDEEFIGLEEDIVKRKKILNPILVWNNSNFIVDGHNRYKILIAHKMDTDNIVTMDFENESDAIEWIYNNQKNRRNLTKSQLVHVWSEWEKQRAKEAEARRLEGNSRGGSKSSSNLNETSEPIRTAAEVAKKIGVSENTYRDMKLVTESGSQEKIDRMNKGGRGNGVSAIAREIREGIKDGYAKCRKCGQIKTVDFFKKNESICKDCYNAYERERREKEKGTMLPCKKTQDQADKTTKLPFANSYAPASYYDVSKSANWTYKEVKGEADFVFKDTLSKLRTIFNQHKEDVFMEDANILMFANEVQRFASSVKYFEKEVRDARHQKELEY